MQLTQENELPQAGLEPATFCVLGRCTCTYLYWTYIYISWLPRALNTLFSSCSSLHPSSLLSLQCMVQLCSSGHGGVICSLVLHLHTFLLCSTKLPALYIVRYVHVGLIGIYIRPSPYDSCIYLLIWDWPCTCTMNSIRVISLYMYLLTLRNCIGLIGMYIRPNPHDSCIYLYSYGTDLVPVLCVVHMWFPYTCTY